jgi:hypothetical protein
VSTLFDDASSLEIVDLISKKITSLLGFQVDVDIMVGNYFRLLVV